MPTNWDNLVISFLKNCISKRKKKKKMYFLESSLETWEEAGEVSR